MSDSNTSARIAELTAQSTDTCRIFALGDNTREAVYTASNPVMALSARSNTITTEAYTVALYSWANDCLSRVESASVSNDSCLYATLTMPRIPRNPHIKRAMLNFCPSSSTISDTCQRVGLYYAGTLTEGAITAPTATVLYDYEVLAADKENYSFDVTPLIDDIVTTDGHTSTNICLRMMDEGAAHSGQFTVYAADISLSIIYEQNYGVNAAHRAYTQDLGFFGQSNVDLLTGALMIESEDFAWGGSRLPVTIKHLYNSALAGYQYTSNLEIGLYAADFDAMKLGTGWRLNLMQSMVAASFVHDGTEYAGYIYIDETGEETHFKPTSTANQYEDVSGGGMLYDSATRTLTQGEEQYLFDEAERLIRITDAHGNQQTITYTDGRLTAVTDGAGRAFALAYDNDGYLTSITAPDGTAKTFTYADDNIATVTYPHDRRVSFTYFYNKIQDVILTNADGSEPYRMFMFLYAGNCVMEVSSYIRENDAWKNYLMIGCGYCPSTRSAGINATEAIETDEETATHTRYTFDADGNVVGEYSYTDDNGIIRPLADGSGTTANINNLLRHHDFSNNDGGPVWIKNNTDFYGDIHKFEERALYGECMYYLENSTEALIGRGIYQDTMTLPAGSYTASAWMRIRFRLKETDTAGAYVRVTDAAGNVLAESEHIAETFNEYVRLVAPFELTEAQSVTVHLLIDGRGGAYFDSVQLEQGDCANDYNLLKNGSAEIVNYWWRRSGAEFTDTQHLSMDRSLKITGDLDSIRSAYQPVEVHKAVTTRETFTLSGWAKADSLPDRERDGAETPIFRLCATINYTDGGDPDVFYADFSPRANEWHRTEVEFAKTRFAEIQDVIVSCEYGYNTGTAYFDDIQLIRTAVERNLTAEDFAVIPDDPTTDTTASADEAPEAEPFEEWLDSFGNALTETTFTDGEFGTLYRAFGYDATGNDLVSETDARGNVTAYTVDAVTSRNEEITDRCGNKTVYEYDESGRTTKVTAKDADGTLLSDISYAYDAFDNLTEITRGDGMKYALAYSAHRDIGSIGIDGRSTPLMSYAYKQGSGRLKQVTYANGDTMKLTYNSIGQAVAEKWYDAAQTLIADYRYAYDGTGNLVRSVDILAAKEYTYTYEDGKIIRAAESTLTFGENLVVIGKTLLYSVWYTYDKDDNLTHKRMVDADGTARLVYYENNEDGAPIVKFEADGKTVLSHSKNDAFGRKEFDELQIGTGFVSRRFEYLAGEVTDQHVAHEKLKSSPTSQLVDRIVLSDGRTISYEYDAEERITKVTDSVEGTTLYTYDALGELEHEIRDNTVVNCMTYDRYGNIRTKNGKAYEYDAVWKDLLTSYDGQPITYDAQGNPTNYLGHVLAWEKGRQLRSFDSNSYTYNANGIRTSKTVGGVKHEYLLDGANILKEVWGENTLIPLYDNEDAVCGILYNNVPYYFLKNLQGDVIEIVDANAEVVARYSYDAWGVCTITQDNETGIASINPFRYRGYYYDSEIGMYYLQSRYYDPVVGRFVNADDAAFATVSGNLFAYCGNEPVDMSDAIGYAPSLYTLSRMHSAVQKSALMYLLSHGIPAALEVAVTQSWAVWGRMDIYSYTQNHVWEVKRNNSSGITAGKRQLCQYTNSYVYSLVHMLRRKWVRPRYSNIPLVGVTLVAGYLVTYYSYVSMPSLVLYDYVDLATAAIAFKAILASSKDYFVAKYLKNQTSKVRSRAVTAFNWLKSLWSASKGSFNTFKSKLGTQLNGLPNWAIITGVAIIVLIVILGVAAVAA